MGMFAWLARWLSQPPRPIPRALWCSTIERYPFLRNSLMQEIEESASMEASGQALGSLFADLKL